MIQSFKDNETADIYDGTRNKAALRRLPVTLWKAAYRKFYILENAASLHDLRVPPQNRLEALKGNRAGQYSIRINDQYRICFRWSPLGPENVEIIDYH